MREQLSASRSISSVRCPRPRHRVDGHVGDIGLVRDHLLWRSAMRAVLSRSASLSIDSCAATAFHRAHGERLDGGAPDVDLGCCAVNETPAVCVWNRNCIDRSSSRRNGREPTAPKSVSRARGYLAISSKKRVGVEEERQARRKRRLVSRRALRARRMQTICSVNASSSVPSTLLRECGSGDRDRCQRASPRP